MSYGNQYQSNPYNQAPSAEAGHGQQHELQQYGQPYAQQPQAPVAHVLTQQDFLAQVTHVRNEMRSLDADIQQVAALHQRALTSSDTAAQQHLESLVAQTQLKNTSIRDQIRTLKGDAERTTDGSHGLKARQVEALSKDFKAELQRYIDEESQYKERYREQIARQYRIVNPEASDQEVQQAADADWGNEGIFQTALKSNRGGQATAVLGNVRARHNELMKIEQSIIELANLFQDLDTLVVQQDPIIQRADEQVQQTNDHLDKGNAEVDKGIKHARSRRRLKWWCTLVVFLIILAIALGVGLGVALTKNGTKTATGNNNGA
ncbi:hypothetical protein P8C59_008510 [Phyllachora maydis]|uniref:t-SNARE coiled-coil homology domain-containing protein n=1 Tax=Phyllachora maydis TaxID=1825666 RepID=A0AAD9IB92_9PEZI|nr:hypothetical protein P8C59_008510 [Phyllachora maydis]